MTEFSALPLTGATPDLEPARLEATRSIRDLLGRDDPRLERIVRLAAAMLRVPTSLITLVDASTQHVLVSVGEGSDLPREEAFCTHVVDADAFLVVEDAAADDRFADNPHVREEKGIRFYAGAPLRSPEGLSVGALCVVDTRPRALLPGERQLLEDLASLAADEVVARRTSATLTAAAARLQHIVGMASHDLRGVLGSMIGFAELLRETLPPEGEQAEFARTIGEAGLRASALMHELLETAMLQGGALALHAAPFDLAALIHTAVRDFGPQARQKSQSLTVRGPAAVEAFGDPRRLRQVLDNLISNALKYSPPGATVCVWIEQMPAPGFVVEDEGPGFTEAERGRAFQPFAKIANTPTGGEPSTGLGLSIAAELVRLNGGTIRLEAGPGGRGARFVVTLPAG